MILLVPNELIRILEKKHHKGSFDTYKYANCPIIAAIEYFFLSHKLGEFLNIWNANIKRTRYWVETKVT